MPSTNQPEPKVPERRVADSLPSAILLAFTGGSLDAFVYLNHGHVFAAAMTGNGVLFGIAILHRDLSQAIRHVLPILAFLLGAFAAKSLDNHLKQRAVTVGLLCEIAILFAVSWLPGSFPDLAFVPLIAVVAAYQITSFRTAEHYAYNSTFMTGNLRTAVDGLYAYFSASTVQDRQAGLRQFHALSLLVAAFMSGAIAGALLAPRLLNRTLWIIELPLVAVLVLVLKRSRREEAGQSEKTRKAAPAYALGPPQR
jgi:uncharacterized membrane protein YoaK (UPF0700 family)